MKKKATRGGKLLLQRVTNGKIPEGETNLPFPILRSRSRDLFYDHRGENSRSLLLPQPGNWTMDGTSTTIQKRIFGIEEKLERHRCWIVCNPPSSQLAYKVKGF
ncbi:uncharacterized protein LOC143215011 isoform X1 [Lasioglossum baleicum]|uniref:uncharacterized protein LOC143215011 isoform X1 n=1 Tax=Lasioglossum baleicum TaxID=434251 RepID=UPI003FCE365A